MVAPRAPRGGKRAAPRARVRLEVDARRAQLIALGLEAFSARPYDAVSIDELAHEAGISKGLLFHYFASKRAFYAAVIEHAAQDLLTRTQGDPKTPPLTRLREGLTAYLTYVDEHAAAFAALMRSGIGSDPALAGIVDRTREALVKTIGDALPENARSPWVRIALRGWVGCVEAASLDWAQQRDVPRDELRAMLEVTLIDALARATERSAP